MRLCGAASIVAADGEARGHRRANIGAQFGRWQASWIIEEDGDEWPPAVQPQVLRHNELLMVIGHHGGELAMIAALALPQI